MAVYYDNSDQINANIAKEVVIDGLANEGLLTCDPEYIKQQYCVVTHRKRLFGVAVDTLLGKLGFNVTADSTFYTFQKLIAPSIEDVDKEEPEIHKAPLPDPKDGKFPESTLDPMKFEHRCKSCDRKFMGVCPNTCVSCADDGYDSDKFETKGPSGNWLPAGADAGSAWTAYHQQKAHEENK